MQLATDWPKLADSIDPVNAVAVLVAIVSLLISIILGTKALRISRSSAEHSKRSADASDRSATASERSAEAADRSVSAADDAATSAAAVASIEASNRHDQMAPELLVEFRWERNRALRSHDLFAHITSGSPRDYRVRGDKVHEGGGCEDIGYRTLHARQTEKIHIGNEHQNLPKRLELAFDTAEQCPCARQVGEVGHWSRVFAIELPPRPKVTVMA